MYFFSITSWYQLPGYARRMHGFFITPQIPATSYLGYVHPFSITSRHLLLATPELILNH
jgi:hypothetical protein